MIKACFDVRNSVKLWENWHLVDKELKREIPEYSSTHPSHEHRAADLAKKLPDVSITILN